MQIPLEADSDALAALWLKACRRSLRRAARIGLASLVLRPGVPGRVDELILRLLAVRPDDRLASAMAVLDLLPRYHTVVSAMAHRASRLLSQSGLS